MQTLNEINESINCVTNKHRITICHPKGIRNEMRGLYRKIMRELDEKIKNKNSLMLISEKSKHRLSGRYNNVTLNVF